MSYFRNQLEDWLKTIDVKADRVLDVGGGANPVKGRTKSWDVKEYKILDNGLEKMKQWPDIVADINNRGEIIDRHQKSIVEKQKLVLDKFDQVFCLEVMEYIYNPLEALRNIKRLLNSMVFFCKYCF